MPYRFSEPNPRTKAERIDALMCSATNSIIDATMVFDDPVERMDLMYDAKADLKACLALCSPVSDGQVLTLIQSVLNSLHNAVICLFCDRPIDCLNLLYGALHKLEHYLDQQAVVS